MKGGIRQVKIEDLLGRDEIKISMDEIKQNFCGKVIMVTGAAGSIGSELCRQPATFGIKRLVLYDNAETPMHNLRLELEPASLSPTSCPSSEASATKTVWTMPSVTGNRR